MRLRFLLQSDTSVYHFWSYRPLRRENVLPQACALVRNDRVGDGAGSPECGVWIGCVLRGRFVKRPYIRFSKLRMRRSSSGFHVRHARAVEDASPYGGKGTDCHTVVRDGSQ